LSLQADNVSLTLGDGDQQVRALDEVSLVVAPGELLAVVGPSGSGKTSLLAVCGGLRTPTAGRIRVGDAEITALPASRLADVRRDRIGFVFQQSNLVPALTATNCSSCRICVGYDRAGRNASGRSACCAKWAWSIGTIVGRPSCPVASANGWASPGR
jgi:ABC-type lipoprotein export system ATPase subunit